jgi:cytochrome c-type biogenesis protein
MNGSEVSLLAAFIAGVVSFISPCVLPIVPVYIAMLTGSDDEPKATQGRLITNTAFFLAGFTLIFLLMGATASLLGQLFLDYQDDIRSAGALFMAVMGLHLTGLIKIPALSRDWRAMPGGTAGGPLRAILLGMAVTAGWTPCTGPILASVLAYAGIGSTLSRGVLLLLAYSAGFAVPFILFAIFFNKYLSQIRSWYFWLPIIQKLAGVMLIITGVLLYFNLVQRGLGIILN